MERPIRGLHEGEAGEEEGGTRRGTIQHTPNARNAMTAPALGHRLAVRTAGKGALRPGQLAAAAEPHILSLFDIPKAMAVGPQFAH